MSPLTIKTMFTTLKWVSKIYFIFGNGEFYFSNHNTILLKLELGMCPKVEKMRPKSYTSPLEFKTTPKTLKWVSKVDFIFGNKEFYFSTHNPTLFRLGLGM
jgi:hypothetical protein